MKRRDGGGVRGGSGPALWGRLTGDAGPGPDDEDRIRLDGWEMKPDVQAAVRAAWDRVDAETIASGADTGWFRDEVGRLYGWDVPGVDYGVAAETTVPWPADVRPTTCTSAATARVNAASGGAA
ncbi:hypothetical protein B6R96_25000 [Streptomyces sp. Sge12]|uniref:hypothetical protein n=1 Tax=Streptomyces sp. Sge12 TaxID=1972846 RepID=UPI0009C208AE|nr:hypothetical protein [Streptomyces sp. Sge12]ARE76794.1 hypothetical protein B6R96_25000 [Streptomyces sp. Sge12]